MANKKLYKNTKEGKLSGVLAGLADYSGIDVGMLRVLFVFLVIFTGLFPGVFFYIAAALVLDEKPIT